jgi:two-component system nitrogen regulation sensor histidine kinase GlnL
MLAMTLPVQDYSAYEFLATGVMVIGGDDRVYYVNPAAEATVGLSANLLIGHQTSALFADSPELRAAIATSRQTRESLTEHDLPLIIPGHAPVRMSATISILEQQRMCCLIELRPADQRLRIARQEQVRMQQEASRELLRNLAHEIKNPLGGIRGAAQLLELELNRESLREYTQVIIKESDRLQSLMDRLLTPHRLPRFSSVNLHEVLERVRSLVLAETPVGLSIYRDYDLSLPECHADIEQLIQATLNIARNAVQAMEGRGTLRLRTRVARHITFGNKRYSLSAHIQIIDDGPGIPAAIRDQIFYPLVSGREGGSGLGLPLAQSLVTQNHGVIECESRPGNTVFSLYFPLMA